MRGLDVEIRDVSHNEDSVEAVIAGQADFGVNGSGLMVARGQGKPVCHCRDDLSARPRCLYGLEGDADRKTSGFWPVSV